MKKKAIALALSLALMLTIFVPGTLAMGTESGKDTNTASQQVSVPQKTETPSEPVDPADPSDPSDPVKPVDPSDPSTPTEEGKPSETTAPTEEGKPTETTAPTEEGKPAETTAPTEESKPTETTAPTEESKPTDIMPQIMAMIQQDILAGGAAQIPGSYFEIVGATYEGTFTVPAGKIEAGSVPKIEGYNFAGAYFDGVQVLNVGQIVYEGQTYTYYTTYMGGVVANILPGDKKIELHYELNPVQVTYDATVNGLPAENNMVEGVNIFPETAQSVTPGKNFAFKVEIPRGYHATVKVDGTEMTPKLGVSPKYEFVDDGGNGFVQQIPGDPYYTDYSYEAQCGTGGSHVEVVLTKDTEHAFSASEACQTENLDQSRFSAGWGETGTFNGDTYTWEFATSINRTGSYPDWTLDSLQVNGQNLKIPFQDTRPMVTELSTGTKVTITRRLERTKHDFIVTWYDNAYFVYTVEFSNCYEDITITGGNLHGSNIEFVASRLDGVEYLEVSEAGADKWTRMPLSVPVAVGDMGYAFDFRFALKPGYGTPVFEIRASDQNEGAGSRFECNYIEEENLYSVYVGRRPDFDEILIDIVSQPIDVTVSYEKGANNNAVDCPSDNNIYNVNGTHQFIIPRSSPHDDSPDPDERMIFNGWKNGDKIYLPGQLVDINELVVSNNKVIFTAQWLDSSAAEKAQYVLRLLDKANDSEIDHLDVYVVKGQPLIIDQNAPAIQNIVKSKPGYKLSDDNVYYYSVENLPTNGELNLYLEEMEAAITYKAVGPDGVTFGSVSPESEAVKISSGTAQGSAPMAEAGFRFIGWYKDEKCTDPVDETWVEANNMLIPKKTGELWEDATYYAKFDYAYADLTITATGIANTYGQQGTIYQVDVKPADGTPEFNFQIAINGNGTKKITDLPYGEYTVTPQNNWSWRYSDQTSKTEKPVEGNDGRMVASVTFHYSLQNHKWLSGNAYSGN